MHYTLEMILNLPPQRVWELIDDPDNLVKWQKGFVSLKHLSGERGRPGATSELVYKMGRREVTMIETIEVRDAPHLWQATFEADGVWNRVSSRFELETEGKTHWVMDNEFRCRGMIRVLAFLFPGMFRRQTHAYMQAFGDFAEHGKLVDS